MNTYGEKDILWMNETDMEVKWGPLLDWSSKLIRPVPAEDRAFVIERLEHYCQEFRKYRSFLKKFIPQVRAMEGKTGYYFIMINGEICASIDGMIEGQEEILSIPLMSESDITNNPYPYYGLYKWNDAETRWEWI